MTAHKIFDGAFVMYSDMHLKECTSYFQSSTDSSLLYIDHCREGRIESEIDNHAYSYLQENEMRVDDRRSHSGRFCFPLCHYHGMTLGFDLDIAVPALKDFFGGFSVDLYELQKKYCNDKKPFVIHNEPGIEHIFSELSMYSYLRRYRMNVAATMLRQDSKKGIAEIAGAVGYESPSKFATAFRQVIGQTPMEYRKSFF